VGPRLEVSHVAKHAEHPLNAEMCRAFESVTHSAIATAQDEEKFLDLYGHLGSGELDWFAREWVIISELNRRSREKRAAAVEAQGDSERPPPYNATAVADLKLCKDCLVPLSAFEIQDGVLVRRGHAFTILVPTPGVNSSYWLTRALDSAQLKAVARVRLDPLLHGPADTFPRMAYRMLSYGPPLRWEDVRGINAEEFGRWMPSSLSHGEFTDFHWSPRSDELHLAIEEVPRTNGDPSEPSRYFHVIFSRLRDAVTHLDGACRFFSPDERARRDDIHLRHTGKLGTRVKVFRLDGEVDTGPVSGLGVSFFVWNYDVAHFFGADIPASLLGDFR
jgi:hypothetical protein